MFIAGAPASEKQVTELMVMAPIRSSKMAFWLSALVRTLQLSQPARYVMARMNALGEAGAAVACTVESGNTSRLKCFGSCLQRLAFAQVLLYRRRHCQWRHQWSCVRLRQKKNSPS